MSARARRIHRAAFAAFGAHTARERTELLRAVVYAQGCTCGDGLEYAGTWHDDAGMEHNSWRHDDGCPLIDRHDLIVIDPNEPGDG